MNFEKPLLDLNSLASRSRSAMFEISPVLETIPNLYFAVKFFIVADSKVRKMPTFPEVSAELLFGKHLRLLKYNGQIVIKCFR